MSANKRYSQIARIQSAPTALSTTSAKTHTEELRHLVTQLGFEGARHMKSDRLPSARRERVVGLRLSELNSETRDVVLPLMKTVKRIDISGIRLPSIPAELLHDTIRLERLDVSQNQIDDLSPLCRIVPALDDLVELLAYSNNLSRLPEDFGTLSHIRRLNLANNSLTSCGGIDQLKCLQVLILDNNRLESLSDAFFENLRRLEVFHCAQNRISNVPSAVRNLRPLRNVDLSGNRITSVPPELLQLPKIEVVNLSRNDVTSVPTVKRRGIKRRLLVAVDLSDNRLVRFPEQLLSISRKLDLSRNQIRTIPTTALKRFADDEDKVLVVTDNPLTFPPLDVCQGGARAILRYFHEIRVHMPTHQGLKVFVVGSSGQGKTSLVQTLIDEQPRLTGDERTTVLDVFDHYVDMDSEDAAYGRKLHLSIWDFSGNDRYSVPIYQFLHQPALVLVVFSAADYDDARFEFLIGNWIDWITSKTNRIVFIPVATHADAVAPARKDEICHDVSSRISRFLDDRVRFVDDEIMRIESKTHITPSLSDHLKHCLSLKRLETVVHPTVVAVSSATNEGFVELLTAVTAMTTNADVFPQVLQKIPSLWDQVTCFAEEQARTLRVPYLPWKEFERQVVERFGMKRILAQITRFLHDTGKIVWFSETNTLNNVVFLDPEWLFEVLRTIFRHDLVAKTQFSANENACGIGDVVSTSRFEKTKKEFLKKGIADRDYLCALFAPIFLPSNDLNKSVSDLMTLVVTSLELGYVLPRTFSADGGNLTELKRQPSLNNKLKDTASQDSKSSKSGETKTSKAAGSQETKKPVYASQESKMNPSKEASQEKKSIRVVSQESKTKSQKDASHETKSSYASKTKSAKGDTSQETKPSEDTTAQESKTKPTKDASSYELTDRQQNGNRAATTDKKTAKDLGNYMVCCLRKVPPSQAFKDFYPTHGAMPCVAAVFYFPLFMPPGTFERLAYQIQSCSQYNLNVACHWETGLYACHATKSLRLYLQHRKLCSKNTTTTSHVNAIRLETRMDSDATTKHPAEEIWTLMLPVLSGIDSFLSRFTGVYVERRMECPSCHKASFIGEWQTPKQLQSVTTCVCDACHENVETRFLIQPREKSVG